MKDKCLTSEVEAEPAELVWCIRRCDGDGWTINAYKYAVPVTRCTSCYGNCCKSAKDFPDDPREK